MVTKTSNAVKEAAGNHGSCRVGTRLPAPIGRIVFSKTENATLQINIVGSPVRYSAEQRQSFGEMIQVLQKEGRVGESGSVSITRLEAM